MVANSSGCSTDVRSRRSDAARVAALSQGWRLKREMKPESFIELRQHFRWKISNSRSDSLHCDRAHLFCLRLRVMFKASRGRAQRYLKRVDACNVRCHGDKP